MSHNNRQLTIYININEYLTKYLCGMYHIILSIIRYYLLGHVVLTEKMILGPLSKVGPALAVGLIIYSATAGMNPVCASQAAALHPHAVDLAVSI